MVLLWGASEKASAWGVALSFCDARGGGERVRVEMAGTAVAGGGTVAGGGADAGGCGRGCAGAGAAVRLRRRASRNRVIADASGVLSRVAGGEFELHRGQYRYQHRNTDGRECCGNLGFEAKESLDVLQ